MTPLMAAADFVLPDEKVWWLMERWETVPLGRGPHLIQQIQVVRGDAMAVHRRDLGRKDDLPKAQQHTQGFNFWAGFEYSVGEVQEIADHNRENKALEEEPQDLVGNWLKQQDEKRQLAAHKSVSGPYVKVERH